MNQDLIIYGLLGVIGIVILFAQIKVFTIAKLLEKILKKL